MNTDKSNSVTPTDVVIFSLSGEKLLTKYASAVNRKLRSKMQS